MIVNRIVFCKSIDHNGRAILLRKDVWRLKQGRLDHISPNAIFGQGGGLVAGGVGVAGGAGVAGFGLQRAGRSVSGIRALSATGCQEQ